MCVNLFLLVVFHNYALEELTQDITRVEIADEANPPV